MTTRLSFATAAFALASALVLSLPPAQAQDAPGAEALRSKHDSFKPQLANSPFQRPLLLDSVATKPNAPQGDVYAVLDQPFASVKAALSKGASWCDVLMLQHNVKRCVPEGAALQVAVGRKHDQPVEDAFLVKFNYALRAAADDHLSVQLAAETGPLGTKNYRLSFQAVPIDAKKTFIHMAYSYEAGTAARLATDAYLATSGRSKVGFSKTADGYIGGLQGVAERNAMRYFLAIEAYLDSLSAPEGQRVEKRLREWFTATERYPQQLREMGQDEYLTMKRRETKG